MNKFVEAKECSCKTPPFLLKEEQYRRGKKLDYNAKAINEL